MIDGGTMNDGFSTHKKYYNSPNPKPDNDEEPFLLSGQIERIRQLTLQANLTVKEIECGIAELDILLNEIKLARGEG